MIIKSWGQQVLNTKSTRLKALARNNYIRIRRLAGIGLYRRFSDGKSQCTHKTYHSVKRAEIVNNQRAIQLLSMLKVSIHDLCHRRFGCHREIVHLNTFEIYCHAEVDSQLIIR